MQQLDKHETINTNLGQIDDNASTSTNAQQNGALAPSDTATTPTNLNNISLIEAISNGLKDSKMNLNDSMIMQAKTTSSFSDDFSSMYSKVYRGKESERF